MLCLNFFVIIHSAACIVANWVLIGLENVLSARHQAVVLTNDELRLEFRFKNILLPRIYKDTPGNKRKVLHS